MKGVLQMKSLTKCKPLLVLSFLVLLASCSDSNKDYPRNKDLYNGLPYETKNTMDSLGMPIDTQIALTMRINSAICETLGEDIKSKNEILKRINTYKDAHQRGILLVSLYWSSSEGYIDKKWTNWNIINNLWLPIDALTCKKTVQEWSTIFKLD
jgi:hypothetical protein